MNNGKRLLVSTSPVMKEPSILSFRAAKAGSNVNLFKTSNYSGSTVSSTYHPASAYSVYINDVLTDQTFTSLTFAAGDVVTISRSNGGKFPAVCFALSNCVSEILAPLPPFTEVPLLGGHQPCTTLHGLFANCTNLTSLREDLFLNNPQILSLPGFCHKCTGLTSIPENIFSYTPNITTIQSNGWFGGCTGLTEIPENLFAPLTKLETILYGQSTTTYSHGMMFTSSTYYGLFHGCTGLTKIPDNLFAHNTKLKTAQGMFAECTGLTEIPVNLFANNTELTDISGAFFGCTGVTNGSEAKKLLLPLTKLTRVDNLFRYVPIPSLTEDFFTNNTQLTHVDCCLSATGISSIPENLLSKLTNLVSVYGLFYTNSSIQSIPENLFANNTSITNFDSCFCSCKGITEIPANLFAKNTIATSFGSLIRGCFGGCTSLTSIPENLFANNTKAVDFSDCFNGCVGLTAIPDNLFSNNTSASNFDRCFGGCTGLTSIPANLFANTAATSFGRLSSGCFEGCTGLTAIPENLFKGCGSTIVEIGSCFKECTGLTSVPENLFSYCTKLDPEEAFGRSFYGTFYECSGLTSIPENLFNNCPCISTIKLMGSIFRGCTKLQSIPKALLRNCTELIDVEEMFYRCSSLTDVELDIPAEKITSASNMFYGTGSGTKTVTVVKNSTTHTTLAKLSGINIVFFGTRITFNVSDDSALVFIDGVDYTNNVYVQPFGETTTYTVVKYGYISQSYNIPVTDADNMEIPIDTSSMAQTTNKVVFVLTPNDAIITTTINGTITVNDTEVKCSDGDVLAYTVTKSGYRSISESITFDASVSDILTKNITLEQKVVVNVNESYPFSDVNGQLTTLANGTSFAVDESLQGIASITSKYSGSWGGTASGYIKIDTPAGGTTLSISCYVRGTAPSSMSWQDNGSARVYVGDNITTSDDGTGSFLVSETNYTSSPVPTYTMNLSGDRTYYVNFWFKTSITSSIKTNRLVITNLSYSYSY